MPTIKPNDPLNLPHAVVGVMPRNHAEINDHVDHLVGEMQRRLESEFAEEEKAESQQGSG